MNTTAPITYDETCKAYVLIIAEFYPHIADYTDAIDQAVEDELISWNESQYLYAYLAPCNEDEYYDEMPAIDRGDDYPRSNPFSFEGFMEQDTVEHALYHTDLLRYEPADPDCWHNCYSDVCNPQCIHYGTND